MSVDLSAAVGRFEVGDRISWNYGGTITYGVVRVMKVDDSTYGGSGDLVAPWGVYLGRLCWILCEVHGCWCQRPGLEDSSQPGHCCNECQLSPDGRPSQPTTLFDFGDLSP